MTTPIRFAAPASVLLCALITVGCGAAITPQPTGVAASPSATTDSAGLNSYIAGMCPIFDAILAIDPRITDLRAQASAADAGDGDLSAHTAEMASLSEAMLVLLNDLASLPDWQPGAALRYHLLTSLHGMRAALLHVARDPAANDAAGDVTAMPFLASEALDRAMSTAAQGGLRCEPAAE